MTEDALFSPLSVIDDELLRLFRSGKVLDSETHLTHIFDNIDENKIPLLTKNTIKSGNVSAHSIVKYRCLVQDMLDIEYYSSVFKNSNDDLIFTKYRDRILQSYSITDIDLKHVYDDTVDMGVINERIPLVCIPIPGENGWMKERNKQPARDQRSFVKVTYDDSSSAGDSFLKRRRTDIKMASTEAANAMDDDGINCLLKIYDNIGSSDSHTNVSSSQSNDSNGNDMSISSSSRPVRLNDMLEVIGILTVDDSHEILGGANTLQMGKGLSIDDSSVLHLENLLEEEGDELDLDHVPADVKQEQVYPSCLYPRVHCLRFRILPSTYPLSSCNDRNFLSVCTPPHQRLVEILQLLMLGDQLAAEYIALILISRAGINAAQRSDMEFHSFGNLNLNLFNAGFGNSETDVRIVRLLKFLEHILPRSTLVDISIDSLNSKPLYVSKSSQKGREKTSQSSLQLGGGTCIILDETRMGEGVLRDCGLKNIKALKDLLNNQLLQVECEYYDVKVPTDISVICFSTSPSIISTSGTIHLHLESQSPPVDTLESNDSAATLSVEDINIIREWWATCRSKPKPNMDAAVVQAAERDFVLARERQQDAVTSSDLHRWILTAQLIALSECESYVTLAHWEKGQELEKRLQMRRQCN